MAAAPAYRFDYGAARAAEARPYPKRQTRPDVYVVPGRKRVSNPPLSSQAVGILKVAAVFIVIFLVIGFARVGLASAAYSTASAASELRADIADARSEGESLAIQKSLVASPSNLRTIAQDKLNMTSPENVETLTLSEDVVAIDEQGILSFSQSISKLAAQG